MSKKFFVTLLAFSFGGMLLLGLNQCKSDTDGLGGKIVRPSEKRTATFVVNFLPNENRGVSFRAAGEDPMKTIKFLDFVFFKDGKLTEISKHTVNMQSVSSVTCKVSFPKDANKVLVFANLPKGTKDIDTLLLKGTPYDKLSQLVNISLPSHMMKVSKSNKVSAIAMSSINGALEIPSNTNDPIKIVVQPMLARVLVKKDQSFVVEHGKLLSSKALSYYQGISPIANYLWRHINYAAGGTHMEDANTQEKDKYGKTPFYDLELEDLKKIYPEHVLFLMESHVGLKGLVNITDDFSKISLADRYIYFKEWTLQPKFYNTQLNETLIIVAPFVPSPISDRIKENEGWFDYSGHYYTESEFRDIVKKVSKNEFDETLPYGMVDAIQEIIAADKSAPNEKKLLNYSQPFDKYGIKFYHQSLNYYPCSIRHFDSTQIGTNGYGKYGVVRGNVYLINIKKISSPGLPLRSNTWKDQISSKDRAIAISEPVTRGVQDIEL